MWDMLLLKDDECTLSKEPWDKVFERNIIWTRMCYLVGSLDVPKNACEFYTRNDTRLGIVSRESFLTSSKIMNWKMVDTDRCTTRTKESLIWLVVNLTNIIIWQTITCTNNGSMWQKTPAHRMYYRLIAFAFALVSLNEGDELDTGLVVGILAQ